MLAAPLPLPMSAQDMMAIYATSKVTLALRSNEMDGDRYHQRAWRGIFYVILACNCCVAPASELQ